MKIPETNIVLEAMPKRALNYYKHLKVVFFWTNIIKFSFLSLSLILCVTTFLYRHELDQPRVVASFTVCALLLSVFLFWQFFQIFFLGHFNKKRVNVFEDRIEIFQDGEKESKKIVLFKDIEKIGRGFLSFFGVFSISTKGDKGEWFRFSAFLHRAEYILESIELERPDLFQNLDFKHIRNNVLSADHRLSRLHDTFHGKQKILSYITYFGFPVFASSFIVWNQVANAQINFMPDYVWSLANILIAIVMLVGLIHFMLTEFVFERNLFGQVGAGFANKSRDLDYEDSIYSKSNPAKIFFIAISFYSIYAFDFNQFGYYRIQNSSAQLNVLENEVFLVDKRFNCQGCNHEVHEGEDVVFINDRALFYGRVIKPKGRIPASENDEPSLTVQINDQGKVISIPTKDILGKVLR